MKYKGIMIDDWNWNNENTFTLIKMSGEARKKELSSKVSIDNKCQEFMYKQLSQPIQNRQDIFNQQQMLSNSPLQYQKCNNRFGGLFGKLLG